MSPTSLTECALVLCVCLFSGAHASSAWHRNLQGHDGTQLETITSIFRPTGQGGLSAVSNYTFTVSNAGRVTTGVYNTTFPGITTLLLTLTITAPSPFREAGCVDISLATTSQAVFAFLSTYTNYLTISSRFNPNSRAVQPVGKVKVSSTSPTPVRVKADPSEQYVVATYSTDKAPQTVVTQFTAYPSGALECASITPAPAPSPTGGSGSSASPADASSGALQTSGAAVPSLLDAAAPAEMPLGLVDAAPTPSRSESGRKLMTDQATGPPVQSPGPSPSQTVQIVTRSVLPDDILFLAGGISNASCIAYKQMGQPSSVVRDSNIDLTLFVLDEQSSRAWASQKFTMQPDNVSMLALCSQNRTSPGQCGSYADNLDSTKKYFVWAATGMQGASSIADHVWMDLVFTAQATGSCASNAVLTTQDDSQAAYEYDYGDYNDESSAAPNADGSAISPGGSSTAAISPESELSGTGFLTLLG